MLQTKVLPELRFGEHRLDHRPILRVFIWALAGSALMAAAAHVQVPFWPVALSLQSAAAVLIGCKLGSRLGGAAILAYLFEGAVGLPVFQSGAGIGYMAGPTGGYLLGFLLAAVSAGLLAENGALKRWGSAFAAIIASVVLIYIPGVAWLSILFGMMKGIEYGLLPFMVGEYVKICLLVALTRLRPFQVEAP